MAQTTDKPTLYREGADALLDASMFPDHVTLLPGNTGEIRPRERVRVQWGQDMLRDVLDGRYRTVVCGVNADDNDHGIIAQLVNLVTASQWSPKTVTSYAKIFHESVSVHAAHDDEPYVLKYDLDSVLVLALLRPKGRDHFTLDDLGRGFKTVAKMLESRPDRQPCAAVSFLGARSNRLQNDAGAEPSFEDVLDTVFRAGYRGDVYPAPSMWSLGSTPVFPHFPFPDSLDRLRSGSS